MENLINNKPKINAIIDVDKLKMRVGRQKELLNEHSELTPSEAWKQACEECKEHKEEEGTDEA